MSEPDQMNETDQISETAQHTAVRSKTPKNNWRRLLSYRWIMKNMFFFLFLAALAVIYIYNGHYADNVVRDISRTNREVKELQYEYKTLKSEVMFRSKQSELAKAVGPFGLKELTAPPYVLIDSAGMQH
jgi:cell division protein FtsL